MRFCIVGTGRCGTTLLRDILNDHPTVAVFNETHWIPKIYEFFGTGTEPIADMIDIVRRTTFASRQIVTTIDDDQLARRLGGRARATVAEFCDAVGAQFASASGKHCWADKTPDYGAYMATLQTLWPSCRFVHLFRNGIDVARSMSSHPGYRWLVTARDSSWCPPSFNGYHESITVQETGSRSEYLALWFRRFERIRDEASRLRGGSYQEFGFEHLLAEPAAVIGDLLRFLELTEPAGWIAHVSRQIRAPRWRHSEGDELPPLQAHERDLLKDLAYLES